MVTFTCCDCNESLKKNKVSSHFQGRRCGSGAVVCIDCLQTFDVVSYQTHTSCMSEAERYQGALYNPKTVGGKGKKLDPQVIWMDAITKVIDDINEKKYDEYNEEIAGVNIASKLKSMSGIDMTKLKQALQMLPDFPNTPRKKPKFMNFTKSSNISREPKIQEMLWDVIKYRFDKSFPSKPEPQKKKAENDDDDDEKVEVKSKDWKKTMKKLIKEKANEGEEEIKIKKLKRALKSEGHDLEKQDIVEYLMKKKRKYELVSKAEEGEDVLPIAVRLIKKTDN